MSSRSSPYVLRALFVAVVAIVQLAFVAHAYRDPHHHFGYQPFSESATWQARIERVTADGRRFSIQSGWAGRYRWNELVRGRGLDWPFSMGHASSGIDGTLAYFQQALDWVARNTPEDRETLYLDADVIYYQNRRGPYRAHLRSVDRELP